MTLYALYHPQPSLWSFKIDNVRPTSDESAHPTYSISSTIFCRLLYIYIYKAYAKIYISKGPSFFNVHCTAFIRVQWCRCAFGGGWLLLLVYMRWLMEAPRCICLDCFSSANWTWAHGVHTTRLVVVNISLQWQPKVVEPNRSWKNEK